MKKTTKFALVCASTIVTCVSIMACSNENLETMVTITDMLGEQISVPKNPKKVACISRTTYDLLIAFGLGDSIDGVFKTVKNSPWISELYPNNVSHYDYEYKVNYELLLSRGVDLVFSPEKYITDGLREHGINAVNISLYGNPTFDNYVTFYSDLITQIWDSEDVKFSSEKWNNKVNTAISTISTELKNHNVEKRKLFYVRGDSDNGIGFTDTKSAFTEYAYRTLGFENYSSNCSYGESKPSVEAISQYCPDVFVCGGKYAKKHVEDIKKDETLSTLNCVKNNQVFAIPSALTQLEQLNALTPEFFYHQANVLYPEIFHFDVSSMIKNSCEEYFGTVLSDQQISYILDCKNPTGEELY